MELGIIGLARSGKSTVFNTLTRGRVSTASGATAKSNIGIAKVPDGRLGVLAGIFKPKRVTNAEVQYIDLLNTPEGLGKDRGMTGEYFNVLQRVDALVHVVRAFENPAVPHVEGSIDPFRDIATLDLELTFPTWLFWSDAWRGLDAELKGAKAQERDRINRESAILQKINQRLLEGDTSERTRAHRRREEVDQRFAASYRQASACASKHRRGTSCPASASWKPIFRGRSTGQTCPVLLSGGRLGRRTVPDG